MPPMPPMTRRAPSARSPTYPPPDPGGSARGELAAGEIASRFSISAPSISRHLGVLKGAGLVTERRDANRILYSLAEERLAMCVGRFLSAVCPEQIVLRHTKWRPAPEGDAS